MNLHEHYEKSGAELAGDGIPLHFGDLAAEYRAGLESAILLDRSHEGRLELRGRDRIDLLQRISTNNLADLKVGEGRATLFINANARIIDRVIVYARDDARLLLLAGPGRGEAVRGYLQRNIFFNDDVQIASLSDTHQFALHGPHADQVLNALGVVVDDTDAANTYRLITSPCKVAGIEFEVICARQKPFARSHWSLIVPADAAAVFWSHLLEIGADAGLTPAGGLTYNTLRIRAGQPGTGAELTTDYIPLELGLWDEISFNKGCYTGQEIIARMESRNRLARAMVALETTATLKAKSELYAESKKVGEVTSTVTAPDGEHFAIAVVKTSVIEAETPLKAGEADGPAVRIKSLLGVQPRLA